MKRWTVIGSVVSTLFVASLLTFGLSAGIPSAAEAQAVPKCKGPKVDRPDECDENSGGHVHAPFVATHEGAIGHTLQCLACTLPNTGGPCATIGNGKITSDIFDVGTTDADGTPVCELLQCAEGGNAVVGCGRGPQPRVDINGLFDLWDGSDPKSQGHPTECFGNGIIDPGVSVATGSAGEINVQLFFRDAVDTTLPGRCGDAASTEINYEVFIGPCSSNDTFPPGSGNTAFILCNAGSEATVIHTGGGGFAAKCGCHATGFLSNATEIYIRDLDL